ncbi:ABC transporter ATP-binding protein [Culicoidibacter larvae]|uniref:ABC transporter ATP-binding protein n=1 Tax=Culicoidibacter larvae TaxID=2579976 RepID=A0A5R8QE09_9FIRM|nr:ABC transporter ATP-binding protein [Culicoidibacter larvae]TLG74233.1 ABC transporter ATP-binding protein [Culicoidibacter larvae]
MAYAIEMLNIRKEFAGIVANDDITLRVQQNEIHALLGENGAGKSTLMSVLFGLYQPEQGKILINEKEVAITNPNIANDLGIGMVHQHFKLVDNFTVTQNIILGREATKGGIIDIKNSAKKIAEISKQYGLDVDPHAKIEDISVGMQQRVEILKMLYRDADILIFDEPTAVLTPQEIEELINIMKRLQAEGKTIILITHKLREIKAVANRCTVIRRGRYIDTVDVDKVNEAELATLMVGHEVSFKVDKAPANIGDTVLTIKDLCVKDNRDYQKVNNLSLELKEGEILGIAGVDGNGQQEFIEGLVGLRPTVSGDINFLGKDLNAMSIRKRTQSGIGHIPEDRHKHGLVLDFVLYENYALQEFYRSPFSHNGILDYKYMKDYATKLDKDFDVRSGEGIYSIARSMSGGNQQKAIVAREISQSPKMLIAVQPTRGLDVGAIEFIHKQLLAERDKGHSILLVSFELDEILNLSDRVAVMYEGSIIKTVDADKTNANELGLLMAGVNEGGEA